MGDSMLKVSESLIKDVINVIAHATHTNVNFMQVNSLLQQLEKLEKIDNGDSTTQC